MNEFYRFLETLQQILDWRYDVQLRIRDPFLPDDLSGLTGSQIRRQRSEIGDSLCDVVRSFGPHLIGVRTPPWMWELLRTELIALRTNFDPMEYDFLAYDPSSPGSRYIGDRLCLKDLFAGGKDFNVGEKIDGSAVHREEFRARAARYLTALVSTCVQIYKRQNERTKKVGTEITDGPTTSASSMEATVSSTTVPDTP